MKRIQDTRHITLIAAALLLLSAGAASAQMGSSAGLDLDRLWAKARADFDLGGEDAVLLLEGRTVTVGTDGSVAERIHRVVWIGTAVGIRSYADLRVPWNGDDSTLDVEILRTWRDGRWWPDAQKLSDTAIVHTLPHALDHADDYTGMRETMLLHDGVELPCIMETAYTITRRGVPGADGVFVFPQRDPAVLVQYTLAVEGNAPVHKVSLNGAPEAGPTEISQLNAVRWTMENVTALKLPVGDRPEAYEPAIVWSTWRDWAALGAAFAERFDPAAYVDGAVADTLRSLAADAVEPLGMVRGFLEFVDGTVRPVHYDHRPWLFAPRPAMRTWETAYGHDLDLVALAAGALRGFAVVENASGHGPGSLVEPVFLPAAGPALAPGVPRLADAGPSALLIDLPGIGTFLWAPGHGLEPAGRPYLSPATGFASPWAADEAHHLKVALTLVLGDEDEVRRAGGLIERSGLFNPRGSLVLEGRPTSAYAAEDLAGLVEGLELETAVPYALDESHTTLKVAGEIVTARDSESGRTRIQVGDPGDGILGRLPRNVLLHDAARTAPVPTEPLVQSLNLRIELGEDEPAHLPEPLDIANAAGRFTVTCAVADGWLVYTKLLQISGAGTWSELRPLLLEQADPLNGTIVLKRKESR